MKITQNGVGIASHQAALVDTQGSGTLAVQVTSDTPVATYRLLGRADADAPWFPLTTAISGELLEALYWVPYVALEVLTGPGATITLWVADN